MQDLTLIGVEDGFLLVSSEDGAGYRIAIDEKLMTMARQKPAMPGAERKVAPREIQAHIRSGMSAEDVAAITGASLEYIQRFEGPVLAERDFIIQSALNVPVHTALDPDQGGQGSTFGSVIRERLHELAAAGERWASWKEAEGGWVVKLSFSANDIDHDARWRYEPKKASLAPVNTEAHTLSQQGELPGGLIPRLRAVTGDDRAPDSSRFDSGAFDVRPAGDIRLGGGQLESLSFVRALESSPEVSAAAIKRAPAEEVESSQTADLLEALRRRRGEREAAGAWDEEQTEPDQDAPAAVSRDAGRPAAGQQSGNHPAGRRLIGAETSDQSAGRQEQGAGRVRMIDVPLETFEDDRPSTASPPFGGQTRAAAKKGRTAMPSWDEIVFGARSDDDLA